MFGRLYESHSKIMEDKKHLPRQQVSLSQVGESFQSWKWKESSIIHREKFIKLLEYREKHPHKVKEVNGVHFCCSKDFLIGMGAGGTRVYVGLSKDGVERAVKCVPKDIFTSLAEQEIKVLTQPNAIESKNVIRYRSLDDNSDDQNLFIILDLCEETLENYVENKSADDLAAVAPKILQQILKGLADLHLGPNPILHRDLKPLNILRNVQDEWLLADFGISRILKQDETSHLSVPRGSNYWKAVESYSSDGKSENDLVRYKKASDIQAAGMVGYYVFTKGQHPFGKRADQLRNILDGKPVGLDNLEDQALKDLLAWMLSHKPEDRPSAAQALKHPYFQRKEMQFELLCIAGNQPEIESGEVNSNEVQQLNSDSTDWRTLMSSDVLKYLCTNFMSGKPSMFKYGSSWTECLRLIRDVNQHWKERTHPKPQPETFYLVGDPQEYFLKVFPDLPVLVHKNIRSCDWKERPDLQKYFKESWRWKEKSKVHREKFVELLEYGPKHPNEVKEIQGVRVCFSQQFLIGKGAYGTQVFVGLTTHGFERAVKRSLKDVSSSLAPQDMKALTHLNTTQSNNVVRYRFLDDKSDQKNLLLDLDLCEETLENYVGRKSADDLAAVAPEIIKQILRGLADLHRDSNPILHRDLKPSNILRDVDGRWLLANFGIRRPFKLDQTTNKQRRAKDWTAAETHELLGDAKVCYMKESDIQVAGMVAYYIVTKGGHPFGEEYNLLCNLLDGNPVGLYKLKDTALRDLLFRMLSHNPRDRPSAEEALKHPYLQSKEKQSEISQSWKWKENSKIHRQKFKMLFEYAQNDPNNVKEVRGVRFCCLPRCSISKGRYGGEIFVGLDKDGIERAVKRLPKDCTLLAKQEMKVFNELSKTEASHVLKYCIFDDKSDEEYLFLIFNLYEEDLRNFVQRKSLEKLEKIAPKILCQILRGLADLHCGPKTILHLDLNPFHIFRDVNDQWFLANFGNSRILTGGTTLINYESTATFFRAVESYECGSDDLNRNYIGRFKTSSDIQVAGMVAYYIVTKGEHPFGETPDIQRNLLAGKPVGLDKLEDPDLKDLLTRMLSHDPEDRPSAEEALKHRYLQIKE